MNKNSKRVLAVVAASALAFGTVATTQANAAAKVKEVTIMFQGPLTGGDAQLGQDQLPGAIFAIAEYNATNPKVKIKLEKADSQCDGTVAANIAPGVAANKKVIGVIGTSCSGEARNSFPSYIAAGLTMVSPSATAVGLTDPKASDRGYPIFHRVLANDKFQAPALVKVGAKGVTSPKFYIVDDQTTYGAGLAQYAKPAAKKAGTIVGSDSVAKGTADYSSVATKVKAAGANVVLYAGYTQDGAKFVKALRDGGYTGVFAAGDGVNTSDLPGLTGKAGEGLRLVAPDVPFDLLVSKEKLAAFTKATGVKVPGLYVTSTYDAANVFIACLKKGKTTRPGIQSCVATGTFDGVSGSKIKFDRYGDIIGGAPVGEFVVKGDKIDYVGIA
ncbi:MAG: branched-chain amino acid ABC transporter substrate-binding protein [Candidatus Nanopelagicaceae bacterium]|jgi:branched-chain amino acid transport system substrate-binding protein